MACPQTPVVNVLMNSFYPRELAHLHSVEETEARGKVRLLAREPSCPQWLPDLRGWVGTAGLLQQLTKHRISKLGPSVPPA